MALSVFETRSSNGTFWLRRTKRATPPGPRCSPRTGPNRGSLKAGSWFIPHCFFRQRWFLSQELFLVECSFYKHFIKRRLCSFRTTTDGHPPPPKPLWSLSLSLTDAVRLLKLGTRSPSTVHCRDVFDVVAGHSCFESFPAFLALGQFDAIEGASLIQNLFWERGFTKERGRRRMNLRKHCHSWPYTLWPLGFWDGC